MSLIRAFICIIALVSLTSCLGNKDVVIVDQQHQDRFEAEPVHVDHVVYAVGDKDISYESVTALTQDSSHVVEGFAKQITYFVDQHIYTVTKFEIIESFKGDLKPGELITLVESGGIANQRAYLENSERMDDMPAGSYTKGKSDAELAQTTEEVFFGSHTMRAGQTRIAFLQFKSDTERIGEPYYIFTGGASEGKFYVKLNKLVRDIDLRIEPAAKLLNASVDELKRTK